jgi:hypothetical protein
MHPFPVASTFLLITPVAAQIVNLGKYSDLKAIVEGPSITQRLVLARSGGNGVRSDVGYRGDKRTPCTHNEFCRS